MKRCPFCNSKKIVASGPRNFFCHDCKATFDSEPSEGGDYSDRNPGARIERKEREQQQRRERHYGHHR